MSGLRAGSVVKGLTQDELDKIAGVGASSSAFYVPPALKANEPLYIHAVGKKDSNKALCLVSQNGSNKYTLAVPATAEELSPEETKEYLAGRSENIRKNFGLISPRAVGSSSPSFGADPEVFVVDGNTGVVIPAWEFLPSKEASGGLKPDLASNEHWDGFQAEAQLKPSNCHQYLVDHIQQGLKNILAAARRVNPAAKLVPDTVMRIPIDMMLQASEEHVALGCAPSTNVYSDEEPLFIGDSRQLAVRFAGGHIHYGGPLGDFQFDLPHIVRTLDRMFSVASVSILQGLEDPIRRKFYGKAGEYRLPPHGLEYRTPSSAMLCHPAITHLCLDLARACMRLGSFNFDVVWDCEETEAREIVNNCDVAGAKKVLQRNERVLDGLIEHMYPVLSYAASKAKMVKAIILDGAKNQVETGDMEKVWALNGIWAKHSDGVNCSIYKLVSTKAEGENERVQTTLDTGRVALAA